MQRVSGYAQQGGVLVNVAGVSSALPFEASYPGCTISVFLQGTNTLASIFADNLAVPTPKSNPFLSGASAGDWFWYAANGRYDIQFSGTGIATPFTVGDILLFDPTAGFTLGGNITIGGNLQVNGNISLQGTLAVTGTTTHTGAVNNVFQCPTSGANFAANLTAGLAQVPVTGGALDCRNLTGVQSMAADVTFTGPVTVFLGSMNLTGTGRFIIPQSLVNANVSLIGIPAFPVGSDGTFFNYTGTDWAVKIGSVAGAITRVKINEMNITLGSSALGGIQAFRSSFLDLTDVTLVGVGVANTQICFDSDGTGGFSTNTTLLRPIFVQCHTAALFTGPISGNNNNQIFGGTLQASGKADTGSIGLNVNTGDGMAVVGCDIESADIAVQFGANSTHNVLPSVRMEGATINTHVKFIAGATFNTVNVVLQLGTLTVSGTTGGTSGNFVNPTGGLGSDGSVNNHIWQVNQNDSSMSYKMFAGATADQLECIFFYDHTQTAQGSLCQDASKNVKISIGNLGASAFLAAANGNTQVISSNSQPIDLFPATAIRFWNTAQTFHEDWTPVATANRTMRNVDANVGFPSVITLHTTYSNATTNFSTIGDGTRTMSWPIAASTDYRLTCDFTYQASASTAGPKIQLTGPSAPTLVTYDLVAYTSTTQAAGAPTNAATHAGFSTSITTGTSVTSTAADLTLRITGHIVNGVNAGTLAVQAAANGAGTLTIEGGSCELVPAN